jgi:hypothetical protein
MRVRAVVVGLFLAATVAGCNRGASDAPSQGAPAPEPEPPVATAVNVATTGTPGAGHGGSVGVSAGGHSVNVATAPGTADVQANGAGGSGTITVQHGEKAGAPAAQSTAVQVSNGTQKTNVAVQKDGKGGTSVSVGGLNVQVSGVPGQ